MKTEALDYYLPEELIAQQPARSRSESRLLVLERRPVLRSSITDSRFAEIGGYLRAGDCLVLNDTKVLAARFFARRLSGAKLEGLFLEQPDKDVWEVMLKGLSKVKAGERIRLKDISGKDFCCAEVVEKKGDGKCVLRVEADGPAEKVLERIGFAPVPPYIKRDADLRQAAKDKERYQTVYARHLGAVAAPTAGLHFTKKLIVQLESRSIRIAYITLHVGEGTFKPVTAERIEGHKIHPERFSIDARNARIINETREKGGRIIAVGTTSVRVLETVAAGSRVQADSGQTQLFITPGYQFKMVDAMVTNFHLPRSTLLALVAAFAGLDTILAAYKHAVEKRYRFYSYGDAMLIM
jgi:S-adenosylmethionine:tRNA ribosyltransferase-isomerase